MKSQLPSSKQSSTSALICGALLLVLLPPSSKAATPDELYQKGFSFYQRGDYLPAAEHLFAYLQVAPPNLTAEFRRQVQEALLYSEQQAQSVTLGTRGAMTNPQKPGLPQLPPVRVTVSAPPSADNNPSYPLACHGGGNMRFSWLPQVFGLPGPVFVIEFERAPQGASASALGPGQCSWYDRAIAPNEPSNVCASFDSSRFGIVWGPNLPIPAITSAAPKFVHDLQRADGWATFDAYNNGSGCLIAKRGGE